MPDDETLPTQASFAVAETLAEEAQPLATGIPPTIDRYRIERRIGAGAMGVVYSGHDPALARPVAVKVMRRGGSPARMKREAQALAQLTHPNVVAVYDAGEHHGQTFVTMALVDGDNLRTWLQTPRTTPQILDAITQAARGLEVAHAAGIVHRDIKPDNIFVAKTGAVLVGDFGLARSTDEPRDAVEPGLLTSSELTQTGALVGTPAYMAPEQVDGEAIAASDQFALCVTAWEALYGNRPFTGRDISGLLAAINDGPPPQPRTRNVPPHVHAAIRRGLAADPKARHPSIAAFVDALGKRRRWPYVAAGVTTLAAVGVIAFALPEDPEKACDAFSVPSGWTVPAGMKPTVVSTLERIRGRYAAEWRDLAKSSCVAAVRHELSEPAFAATMRCLDFRRGTLLWATKQPTDPLGLAEALEPIETCRGRDSDAEPSLELAALQRDLSRATAFVHHVPEQANGLEQLLALAVRLDDPASIAEANYLLGLSQHARALDPTESLRAAIAAAERARDDRIRTRAFALLAIVTARKGKISEAVRHRDLAVSAAVRANDPVTAIAVERATIELAFISHDLAAEIAAFRRIEAIQRARFGELSRSLVDTRFLYAGALSRKNDPDAKRVLDLAFEGLKQLTDMAPEIALQQAAMAEHNPTARLPIQERIVELVRREHPSTLGKELEVLAYDYELVGAYDRALLTMREAIEIDASPTLLETAAYYAFEIADRSDDDTVRAQRLAEALGFLEKLPAIAQDRDSVQAIRGRILLRAGRHEEAIPHLTTALAVAERKEPQEPYHIAIRSFALAQALWQVGGTRDRERAVALADQAARRLPLARAELVTFQNGALLGRVDDQLARIDAWRRTHH